MRFVSALGGGRLVDRFGERIILATGIGIVAVSTGLAGLSQSYMQLLVLRGIGGVGSAMFTVSATALLFRVVDAANRGRATGLFQSGFLIGGLLGPLFGGFLTDVVAAAAVLRVRRVADRRRRHRRGLPPSAALDQNPRPPSSRPPLRRGRRGRRVVGDRRDGAEQTRVEEPQEAESTTLAQAWSHPAYRAAVSVNFAVGLALFGVRFSLGAALRHQGPAPGAGVDRHRLRVLVGRAGGVHPRREQGRRRARSAAGDDHRVGHHGAGPAVARGRSDAAGVPCRR